MAAGPAKGLCRLHAAPSLRRATDSDSSSHPPPPQPLPTAAVGCRSHPALRMETPRPAPSPFPGVSAPISEAPINFFRSAAHVSVKPAACGAGGSPSCQERRRGDEDQPVNEPRAHGAPSPGPAATPQRE